jgi:hypothetical protein
VFTAPAAGAPLPLVVTAVPPASPVPRGGLLLPGSRAASRLLDQVFQDRARDAGDAAGRWLEDGPDAAPFGRPRTPRDAGDGLEALVWDGLGAESDWLQGIDPTALRGRRRRELPADQPAGTQPDAAAVADLDVYFARAAEDDAVPGD